MDTLVKQFIVFLILLVSSLSINAQSKESERYYRQGINYVNIQNFSEAENCFRKAWEIDSLKMPKSYFSKKSSQKWEAYCLYKLGKEKEATKISDTYKTKPYDRNIMQKADSLISLAQELPQKEYSPKIKYYRQAGNIYKESIGEYSEPYGIIKLEEGVLLMKMSEYRKAINCFEHAFEIFSTKYGYKNKLTSYCRGLLVPCYMKVAKLGKKIGGNLYQIALTDSNNIINKSGIVYITESENSVILPTIYTQIDILEPRYLKLETNSRKREYQLFDIMNNELSQKLYMPYYEVSYIGDNSKKESWFKSGGDLMSFNGDIISLPNDTKIESNNNKVYFTLNSFVRTMDIDSIGNLKRLSYIFESEDTIYDNFSIEKSINNNLYVIKAKNNKVGILKIGQNRMSVIAQTIYDNYQISNEHTLLTKNGKSCIVINNNSQRISKEITFPYGSTFEDEYSDFVYMGKDKNTWFLYSNYIFNENGEIYRLPSNAYIYINEDGSIILNTGTDNKRVTLSHLVSFVRDYNKMQFNIFAFNSKNIKDDNNMVSSSIFIEFDYPKDSSTLSKKIRQECANIINSSIAFTMPNQKMPFQYISYNDKTPEDLLQYAYNTCKTFFHEYNIQNSINEIKINPSKYYARFLPLWEGKAFKTYLKYTYSYEAGGAHGFYRNQFITYSKKSAKNLTVSDIISPTKAQSFKKILLNYLAKEKQNKANEQGEEITIEQAYNDLIEYQDLQNKDENNILEKFPEANSIALAQNGIIIAYEPYILDAFAYGEYVVTIPYNAVTDLLNSEIINNQQIKSVGKIKNKAYKVHESKGDINYFSYLDASKLEEIKKYVATNKDSLNGLHIEYTKLIAKNYEQQGNIEMAKKYSLKVLDILEKSLGENNFYTTSYKTYLLERLVTWKDLQSGYRIGKSLIGYNNSDYTIEENVAKLCYMSKDYRHAVEYQSKALKKYQISEQTFNKEEDELALLCNLCRYYWNIDHQKSLLIINTIYNQAKSYLSNINYKFVNKDILNWYKDFMPIVGCYTQNDSIITNAYNAVLMTKNLELNIEANIRNILDNSNDTEITRNYESLSLLNKQYLDIVRSKIEESKKEEISNLLNEKINDIEKELVYMSEEYGDYKKSLLINKNDINKALRENEIAIEFAYLTQGEDSLYVAFTLKKGQNTPRLIPIFNKKSLNSSLTKLDQASLSKLIWEPILPELKNIQKVIFSPSYELYMIGIEYLPICINGKTVQFNNYFKTYRVSSTRELVIDRLLTPHKESNNIAVLYGGIDYDHSKKNSIYKNAFYSNFAKSNLDRGSVDFLPGSKEEVKEISKIFEQTKYVKIVKLYEGEYADECSFKELSDQNVNILHISTHGFSLSYEKAKKKNYIFNIKSADNNQASLLRSGLLLAGANSTLVDTTSNSEDGILTALEIANMNLSHLNLVVLSACDTGLGELTYDGVSGIQKGFKKAGAKSMLITLGKVDDNATQILMTFFYKNLCAGMNKHEALNNAQNSLRKYNNQIYSDPKYWAKFILVDALE